MPYILIMAVVTWLYAFLKTHLLKISDFIERKLYFYGADEKVFKEKKKTATKPPHTYLQDICIHTFEIKPLHPLRTYGMGGNICKWYDQWGVNTENIETSYTTQHQKSKQHHQNMYNNVNRHLSETEPQMSNGHMERCSTSLIIREMQIKTTVRYYLTWVWMAIIKSLQIINAGADVEKREPSYTVSRNANWWSHYGKQYEVSFIYLFF